MKQSVLKFSEDGTEFHIIFKNDAESIVFGSKEAGIDAVFDLVKKEKISVGEFTSMRDEILQGKNLPWSEVEKKKRRGSPFGGLTSSLLTMLAVVASLEHIVDVPGPSAPVEEAYLKVLDADGPKPYGVIYTKTSWTSKIPDQKFAIAALEKLKERGDVTEEEVIKVKLEIEKSALPVDCTEKAMASAE